MKHHPLSQIALTEAQRRSLAVKQAAAARERYAEHTAQVAEAWPVVREAFGVEVDAGSAILERHGLPERFSFTEHAIRADCDIACCDLDVRHPDDGQLARIQINVCATTGVMTLQHYRGAVATFEAKGIDYRVRDFSPEHVQRLLAVLFQSVVPEPPPSIRGWCAERDARIARVYRPPLPKPK